MKKILITTITILIIVFCLILNYIGNIQIRSTKDYATIYVDSTDTIDAQAMINPPKKYSALLQIEPNIRKGVALYMSKNNYILKPGKQTFIRINPTLKELIKDGFIFESIN